MICRREGGAWTKATIAVVVGLAAALPNWIQPVGAVGFRTTAKPIPGLDALHAFKAAEAEELAFKDLSLPAHILHSITKSASNKKKGHSYGPYYFTQPLDHFANTTNATFEQRFWVSTKYYNPKSHKPVPVYVVDGGETSGAGRIPFLEQGILDILAEATDGISIVLEHRYYGASKPKLSDIGNKTYWDVDALRWLNNEQALEDSARFMRNVKIPGVEVDLSANKTPWVYIGGSYAGARAAHMRVLYPDIVFGAISSSGVTAALDMYSQYYYPIARGADPACSQAIQAAVGAFDAVAVPAHRQGTAHDAKLAKRAKALRHLFDADDLDWDDLANLITEHLGHFQALNWDPAVSGTGWDNFCKVMTNQSSVSAQASLLTSSSSPRLRTTAAMAKMSAVVQGFERASESSIRSSLAASGLVPQKSKDHKEDWLPNELVRLASYVRAYAVEPCRRSGAESLRACFSTKHKADWEDFVHAKQLGMSKAWMWQVCTQWGYFQGAAPRHPSISNNPASDGIRPHRPGQQQQIISSTQGLPQQMPFTADVDSSALFEERAQSTYFTPGPKIVSELLTLSYTSAYCPLAYPSTKLAGVPDRPDIASVNALGAFEISIDRLAIINGQYDPWRGATPHSEEFAGGGSRPDTLNRPFKLIPNCWHHCDENGLPSEERKKGKEPERIRKIHEEEIQFVKAWLADWKKK
ncbi:Serine carboxypeptidase S28 [Tilletia horrida]|uniref:Serine carboxypeptidase S28 n=1 Tax=Tilletia horrida TaxID=155126 RepID=A0AAN6GKQ8_9BASI|nr:Serine carboxypeptidase S28 [Tilletia horrida]KAK0560875.1 Serine carboxypeptidase S28 [Tilletia horrida]